MISKHEGRLKNIILDAKKDVLACMLKHCIIKLEGVHLLEFLDFREILLHLRCPKKYRKISQQSTH